MGNAMKKVLIIIGKLYVGGAERVARDIGYFADPERFEIHYLVFGQDIGAYERELQEKGCKIFHMDPPRRDHAAFCRALKDLIRRENYDVIHSHTMFNSGWAMMIGKQCGVPVRMVHSHSIRGPEKRGFLKNTYEKTMRQLILRCATHCIGCGKGAGEWLYGAEYFQKKGILIFNGISLGGFAYDEHVRRDLRHRLGLEDRFVIGHAGHMAPVKNQKFLVEQMPEILKRKPNAVLLLLGDGNDRDMLENRIRQLGLEDHVRMTGNVSNVGAYLNAMDVFAFPSLYEGMPLAMIEAQTNGLPCVISEKIPGDVHLTDLITALPLENSEEQWITALCAAQRTAPEAYFRKMQEMGFDTGSMLERIYALYEG